MKTRRILKKRRDGIKQHYHIGRKSRSASPYPDRQEKSIFKLIEELNELNDKRKSIYAERREERERRGNKDIFTKEQEEKLKKSAREELKLAEAERNKEIAISEEFEDMNPSQKIDFLKNLEPNPEKWPKLIKGLKHGINYEEDMD